MTLMTFDWLLDHWLSTGITTSGCCSKWAHKMCYPSSGEGE